MTDVKELHTLNILVGGLERVLFSHPIEKQQLIFIFFQRGSNHQPVYIYITPITGDVLG